MNQKDVISLMKEERTNILIALSVSFQKAINTWN